MHNHQLDEAILKWIAAQTCDYHESQFSPDCGFCRKAFKAVTDAFQYGRDGSLPLYLAEKLKDELSKRWVIPPEGRRKA